MGIIVLTAFWTCVGLTLVVVGWKPAAVFAALWGAGFWLFPVLGISPPLFVSYQAILAIPMAIWIKAEGF